MTQPPADTVALLEAIYAAFARRDLATLTRLADPAFELHAPTATMLRGGEPYRGHDGLRRYLADVERLWDRLELEVDELRMAADRRVVALGRLRVHGAGRMIDAPAAWVWRLRDGRALSAHVFETRRAALAAVGDPG